MPFLVNGLIRVGNRIDSANIPYGQKHQVIISSKHPLASLVVLYFHEKNFFFRTELTLNLIKEKFWSKTSLKTLICEIINTCSYCKRLQKQPIYMSVLSIEKLSTFTPPFFYCVLGWLRHLICRFACNAKVWVDASSSPPISHIKTAVTKT